MDLVQALTNPDSGGLIRVATVSRVFADGTVEVDYGGGRKAAPCIVLASYTPQVGDPVRVVADVSSVVVLGTTRTANPATVVVGRSWRFPFNITQAAPALANPLVVNAVATRSWREADGWAAGYLPTADTVGQGAYSPTYGYYRGCYFYGANAFTGLAGRSCARLRIRVSRTGTGGQGAATQQVLATHAHATQPADSPYFVSPAFNAGSLAWSTVGTFDLPTFWGNDLIAGTAKGIGHLLLATGNGNYSLNAGLGADGLTGQILLDWV